MGKEEENVVDKVRVFRGFHVEHMAECTRSNEPSTKRLIRTLDRRSFE